MAKKGAPKEEHKSVVDTVLDALHIPHADHSADPVVVVDGPVIPEKEKVDVAPRSQPLKTKVIGRDDLDLMKKDYENHPKFSKFNNIKGDI